MPDSYVVEGQVYPDEATATVLRNPDIPDEIKQIYTPKTENNPTKITVTPDAPRMPLAEEYKPAGEFKSSGGTQVPGNEITSVRPSNELPDISDVPHHDWIEDTFKSVWDALKFPGEVSQGTADPNDVKRAMNLATMMTLVPANAGSEVLGTGGVKLPSYGWTKSPGYAYEQMGNGKYEVYKPETGITQAIYDTAEEARNHLPPSLISDKDFQANIDAVEKMIKAMEEQDNLQKVKSPDLIKNPYQQQPLYYHEKTATWEYHPEEVEKLSPKEAFLKGINEARSKFKQSMLEIKNNLFNMTKLEGPSVSPRGDYTEPAYRGLIVYDPKGNIGTQGPNPVYNYTKGQALYSTANPKLADMYAGYLSTHPGYHVAPGTFAESSQVMPLIINTKDYHYFDAKGDIWQKANKKAIHEAKQKNKKGVIVDNVYDEPNSTKALGKPNKIFITFPEGASTVKSRFASKFDSSSENMLHTIAGLGIGTGALGYISQEQQE